MFWVKLMVQGPLNIYFKNNHLSRLRGLKVKRWVSGGNWRRTAAALSQSDAPLTRLSPRPFSSAATVTSQHTRCSLQSKGTVTACHRDLSLKFKHMLFFLKHLLKQLFFLGGHSVFDTVLLRHHSFQSCSIYYCCCENILKGQIPPQHPPVPVSLLPEGSSYYPARPCRAVFVVFGGGQKFRNPASWP